MVSRYVVRLLGLPTVLATEITPVVVSMVIPATVGEIDQSLVPVPRVAVKAVDVRAIPYVVVTADPPAIEMPELITIVNI